MGKCPFGMISLLGRLFVLGTFNFQCLLAWHRWKCGVVRTDGDVDGLGSWNGLLTGVDFLMKFGSQVYLNARGL